MSTPEIPAGGGPVLPTDAGAPVDSGPQQDDEPQDAEPQDAEPQA